MITRPNGTGGGGRKTWAEIAKNSANRAERENRLTWTDLLDQASSAVMAETDPYYLKAKMNNLIQTCQNWRVQLIEENTQKTCIARIPDNGDNIACGKKATSGDFCEEHAHT